MTDDHLQEWGLVWRQQAAFDIGGMLRAVEHSGHRMRLRVAAEIIGSLASTGTVIWMLSIGSQGPWRTWGLLALLLIWGFVAAFLWVRRGLWKPATMAPVALLERARRQALTAIRIVWLNAVGLLLLLLVSLPFIWESWRHAQTSAALAHWRLLVLVNGLTQAVVVAILATLGRRTLRRERDRLRAIERLRDELASVL
jgi:hypothetical protein